MSAADGTNVVKVFQSAVDEAKRYKDGGGDVMGEMLSLLNTDSVSGIGLDQHRHVSNSDLLRRLS